MCARSVSLLFSLILTFHLVGLAESLRTSPLTPLTPTPGWGLMDGVDPDLMINVTCLQKPPLRPPVPDLVLVGGPLRLWVPLFPIRGPFRVMALCHFSATQR